MPRRVGDGNSLPLPVREVEFLEAGTQNLPQFQRPALVRHRAGSVSAALVDDEVDALKLRRQRGILIELNQLVASVNRLNHVFGPRIAQMGRMLQKKDLHGSSSR